MSHIFDPLNIFVLAVAVIVFWRLTSVLGRRTGNERPPLDPFSAREKLEKKLANGTVSERPGRRQADSASSPASSLAVAASPIWEGFASKGSALAKGLEKIAAADRQFSPSAFLEGAKTAYEMIVTAFATGDKQTLKPLLSRDVYDGFARAIDQRRQAGEVLDTNFVGINKAQIGMAELVGKKASITVRFTSDQISSKRNKAGDMIEGDPKKIREISDIWTFERDVSSRDPNWTLIATGNPS
ncbi:MAG TPA: Tim44/TimA family putative adaptor protein [Aestuariivirgaceae bacterium]|jgi:predicted lipid-binding transport protein (Tim44 family)